MRIGFIARPEENEFAWAAEHGFPCVEFNRAPGGVTSQREVASDVRKWSKTHGVDVSSFGYFGAEYFSDDEATRKLSLDDATSAVETCAELGAPVFVLGTGSPPMRMQPERHPSKPQPVPIDEACRMAVETLGPIVQKAESLGLKVAFYNCDWANFCYNKSAWGMMLAAFPKAGIKFDPSHPFYRGEDYLAQMRDWGHRFHHTHAKGGMKTLGGERIQDPPAGMDQIDWPSFMAMLHLTGYEKDLNLEPHAHTWNRHTYTYPVLFTLTSLDGKSLESSRRVRAFHGFGESTLAWRGDITDVKREEVI